MIHTGGQGNEMISELSGDTCVIQGHFLDIVVKIIKFLLRVSLEKLVKLKYVL